MKRLLKADTVGLVFLISAITTTAGFFIFPMVFDYTIGKGKSITVGALVLSIMTISMLFLLQLLADRTKFYISESKGKLFDGFGGLLLIILFLIFAWVIISLLYGLLAVLIEKIMYSSFSITQIQGVINVFTSFLTLIIFPLAVHLICAYLLGERKLKGFWQVFTGSLKKSYLKLLLLLISVFAVGYLTLIPFNYWTSTAAQIVKIIVLTLLGGVGLFLLLLFYEKENNKSNEIENI